MKTLNNICDLFCFMGIACIWNGADANKEKNTKELIAPGELTVRFSKVCNEEETITLYQTGMQRMIATIQNSIIAKK